MHVFSCFFIKVKKHVFLQINVLTTSMAEMYQSSWGMGMLSVGVAGSRSTSYDGPDWVVDCRQASSFWKIILDLNPDH